MSTKSQKAFLLLNVYTFKRRKNKLKSITLFTTLLLVCVMGCKKVNNITDAPQPGAANTLTTNTATGDEFTIAVIPDTQYYTAQLDHSWRHGKQLMFQDQMSWILANKTAENIVYVAGLGDISDNGDSSAVHIAAQWTNASSNGGYYQLETAGIPYGVAVGNHDQTPSQQPLVAPNTNFNSKFGAAHYTGKTYYGGSYDSPNNDSHYDLFTAAGVDFIVIYIEYDEYLTMGDAVINWAAGKLTTYASRKAIIVSHYIARPVGPMMYGLGTGTDGPGLFGSQGQEIYDKLKTHSNIFLFLGGHVNGECYRQDTYNGKTIKSIVADYQYCEDLDGRANGGDGYLRLLKISVANDLISVRTISPYLIAQHDSLPTNPNRLPVELTALNSKFTRSLFHEATTTRTNDYNNNGKSELSLYVPGTGAWKTYGNADRTWGQPADIPVPGDYDGDGQSDVAIWRPSDFSWHISTATDTNWGAAGDIPVPADYTGDGKCDVAIYRPSTFHWYIIGTTDVTYGAAGDIPVPGDYDGDGKVDVALWRPSDHTWYVHNVEIISWGLNGDIPVPGDYNGDGHVDYAVFRPSDHTWYIKDQIAHTNSSVNLTSYVAGDIPAPGDYDGDGKTDAALYRPSTGQLYVNNVLKQTITGATSPKLVNLPYSIRKFFFP